MIDPSFQTLMRYFSLVIIVVIAINLAYGKYRSRALIEAGITTADEVSKFVRSTFALFGGAFLAFWIIQFQSPSADLFCLMKFPPSTTTGIALWTVQALLSGTVVWWLWARDGHEILARLAPAFTSGDVLKRRYSPTRVRLAISALAIGAPLMNIVIQLVLPQPPFSCPAI